MHAAGTWDATLAALREQGPAGRAAISPPTPFQGMVHSARTSEISRHHLAGTISDEQVTVEMEDAALRLFEGDLLARRRDALAAAIAAAAPADAALEPSEVVGDPTSSNTAGAYRARPPNDVVGLCVASLVIAPGAPAAVVAARL